MVRLTLFFNRTEKSDLGTRSTELRTGMFGLLRTPNYQNIERPDNRDASSFLLTPAKESLKPCKNGFKVGYVFYGIELI